MRPTRVLATVLAASLLATQAGAQGPAATPKPTPSWENAATLTPEELARALKSPGAGKPALFHVGFRVLFAQAHIPGSQFAGPGREAAGLDALRKAVSKLPKTTEIVLYCGCCPWERCPNLEKPWKMLVSDGFANVKVLKIPTNFGRDWVDKGFPVGSGDSGRG